ncbi:MAG: DUF933 domain-containing protein, partial [Planctomycetota bacterium]
SWGGVEMVEIAGKWEVELQELSEEEREEFLEELGRRDSGLERLTQACYRAFDRITFFTVGADEVRAWSVPRGAKAPRAARAIHSDMERGFIRAEVMKFADWRECRDERKLKERGKYYLKGKDYVVEDGDILKILFSV